MHEVAFRSPLKAFAPILFIATSGLTETLFPQDQRAQVLIKSPKVLMQVCIQLFAKEGAIGIPEDMR